MAPKSNKDIVQWIDERTGKPYGGQPMPRYIVGTAHFNADSVGYNADILTKAPNQVGWQELLNTKWKGKVALLKEPGIVMQDIGNALKALGIFKPVDMGNMTGRDRPGRQGRDQVQEGGAVPRLLGQLQRIGQPDGLEGGRGRVDAVTCRGAARRPGINVKYAAPPTGFRGWCSANGIAAHVASDPRSCRPPTTT